MTCKKLLFVQFAQPLLILQSNVFVHHRLVFFCFVGFTAPLCTNTLRVRMSLRGIPQLIQHIYLLSFLLFICLTTGPDPHVGRLSASLDRHSENLEATSTKHINELHSLSTFHLLCRPCLSPPHTPVPVQILESLSRLSVLSTKTRVFTHPGFNTPPLCLTFGQFFPLQFESLFFLTYC